MARGPGVNGAQLDCRLDLPVKRYWTCPCGTRNERLKQKCTSCRRARPKPRVPAHAKTLRDDGYAVYVEVARAIHGVTDESCCVCRKPRTQERHHDRDHDHRTGKPRGLACVHCNKHMPRGLTLELAEKIVAYLSRVESFYGTARDPHLPEAYPTMTQMQREAARLSAREGSVSC